jgi:molybdate transport system substrate-binding protein
VAVAANFQSTLEKLAKHYETTHAVQIRLSAGASGGLYAQILNGAPYHIFFSADEKLPKQLETAEKCIAGSRATYATGHLILWSRDPALIDPAGAVLRSGTFAHLAIADPKVAPYGLAAQQTLERLGIFNTVKDRLVTGTSIAQTHQFIMSGAAELGFIALSQIRASGSATKGSLWLVDPSLHDPIRQQVVLLSKDPAAADFLAWVLGSEAKAIIAADGY